MVRNILDGRKTMTRRVLNPQPQGAEGVFHCKYAVGDHLWVREAWRAESSEMDHIKPSNISRAAQILYEADGWWGDNKTVGKLRPSIFMPRWASRITLEVTTVKVGRLQDISVADAIAEGVSRIGRKYIECGSTDFDKGPNFYCVEGEPFAGNYPTAKECFCGLWDTINGIKGDDWEGTPFNSQSWRSNPWVAAYSFKVVKP